MKIVNIEKEITYKIQCINAKTEINIKVKTNGDIEINKPIGEILIKPQYSNQILIK